MDGFRVEKVHVFTGGPDLIVDAVLGPGNMCFLWSEPDGLFRRTLRDQWREAWAYFERMKIASQKQADEYARQIGEGIGVELKAYYKSKNRYSLIETSGYRIGPYTMRNGETHLVVLSPDNNPLLYGEYWIPDTPLHTQWGWAIRHFTHTDNLTDEEAELYSSQINRALLTDLVPIKLKNGRYSLVRGESVDRRNAEKPE